MEEGKHGGDVAEENVDTHSPERHGHAEALFLFPKKASLCFFP